MHHLHRVITALVTAVGRSVTGLTVVALAAAVVAVASVATMPAVGAVATIPAVAAVGAVALPSACVLQIVLRCTFNAIYRDIS